MPPATPERLLDRLTRQKSIAAVLLLGTDHYLREMCRAQIIRTCVPEAARDWAVVRLSVREAGWEEILKQAETLPMLAPRQVILVEDVEAIEKLGERSRDEAIQALDKYLSSPAPFTVLLLEASALDGRQKLRKLLGEKALVVELTIGSESAALLATRMAADLGAEIDRAAAALLADIVNAEPARMRVELEKLATYALGRVIAASDVEAVVVAARRNTVWQLTDMLASRRRRDALVFLDNLLREGEQPIGIVGALAWTYRKLIEARDLPAHTGGFQAARQLAMRPEAAEAAVRQAHRVPQSELLSALIALADADSQLKSSNPDPRALMEFLVARLTSPTSTAASWTA